MIEAETTRTIPMTVDLTAIGAIDQVDSQVYPASIKLLADESIVATLVTPVIYLVAAAREADAVQRGGAAAGADRVRRG